MLKKTLINKKKSYEIYWAKMTPYQINIKCDFNKDKYNFDIVKENMENRNL